MQQSGRADSGANLGSQHVNMYAHAPHGPSGQPPVNMAPPTHPVQVMQQSPQHAVPQSAPS